MERSARAGDARGAWTSAASSTSAAEVELAAPQEIADPADELASVPQSALGERASVVREGLPVAGHIEVEGALPAHVQAVVVAHAHRPHVSRLNSLRLEAPVASDGSFEFQVPRGTSLVSLDLESPMLSATEEVEVRPGRRDVVLRALAYGTVRGRIALPASLRAGWNLGGLEGVYLHALESGEDPEGRAEIDARGEFTLLYVPAGTGFELEVENPWGPQGRLELAPLGAGEVREVRLALLAWVTIAGRVVDESGALVEGAEVERVGTGERDSGWFLDDADREELRELHQHQGEFRFEHAAPGRVELVARAQGFLPARLELEARPGPTPTEVVLVLKRGGTLRASVRWPDGELATLVDILSRAGEAHLPGEFELSGLDGEPYDLRIDSERESGWGHASAARVHAGDHLELLLNEEPWLRIEVVGADGRPVEDFGVQLEGADGVAHTEVGHAGAARARLTPGSWALTVRAFGSDAQHRNIVFPGDARDVQRFTLTRAPHATGRVVDPRGRPRAGAVVFLDGPSPPGLRSSSSGSDVVLVRSSPREVETDDDGRFEVEIESGGVVLRAKDAEYGTSAPLEVRARGSETLANVELALRPACTLRGRALDAQGYPVGTSVRVTLEDGATEELWIGADGAFASRQLAPGTARVELEGGLAPPVEVRLDPGRPAVVELRVPAKE